MPIARIALIIATIAGLALLARTLIIGPVPLQVAAGAMAGYFCLIAAGFAFPRLEMFADVVWRVERGVVLTIQGGPHPDATPAALAALAKADVTATFFFAGREAALLPELVAETEAAGHEIGVSGFSTDRGLAWKPPTVTQEQIELATKAVSETIELAPPVLFRPDSPMVSSRLAAGVKRANALLVGHTVRLKSDELAGDDHIADVLRRGLKPGSIVRLDDDGSGSVAAALPTVLRAIADSGLTLGAIHAEP